MTKAKLPKRLAGVKIPKPWRRAAEAALAELATPAGRELAAAALVAAAAALTREVTAAGAGGPARDAGRAERAGMDVPVNVGALIGLATTALGRLRAANERGEEPGAAAR